MQLMCIQLSAGASYNFEKGSHDILLRKKEQILACNGAPKNVLFSIVCICVLEVYNIGDYDEIKEGERKLLSFMLRVVLLLFVSTIQCWESETILGILCCRSATCLINSYCPCVLCWVIISYRIKRCQMAKEAEEHVADRV